MGLSDDLGKMIKALQDGLFKRERLTHDQGPMAGFIESHDDVEPQFADLVYKVGYDKACEIYAKAENEARRSIGGAGSASGTCGCGRELPTVNSAGCGGT